MSNVGMSNERCRIHNIPLLAEEGWLRHQQNVAKPPKRRRRGGQTGATFRRTDHLLRLRPIGLALRDPARQLLLSCRATPPLRGGECPPYCSHMRMTALCATVTQ